MYLFMNGLMLLGLMMLLFMALASFASLVIGARSEKEREKHEQRGDKSHENNQ